ncbi:MAG: energy transducer TonB, partial [Myxococcaceae bacterium]|nr:energy transducer TonB [Myxococcaceae bacterium]
MFDQVLGRKGTSGTGVGIGTVVSVLIHVALLGVAIWMSTRPPPVEQKEPEITF